MENYNNNNNNSNSNTNTNNSNLTHIFELYDRCSNTYKNIIEERNSLIRCQTHIFNTDDVEFFNSELTYIRSCMDRLFQIIITRCEHNNLFYNRRNHRYNRNHNFDSNINSNTNNNRNIWRNRNQNNNNTFSYSNGYNLNNSQLLYNVQPINNVQQTSLYNVRAETPLDASNVPPVSLELSNEDLDLFRIRNNITGTNRLNIHSNNNNESAINNVGLTGILRIISEFASPVTIAPTQEQIESATRRIVFEEIDEPINICCPISLERFEEEQVVSQIRHCGHIFNTIQLQEWFTEHVICPICRYDIRDYRENSNTIMNNRTV